MIERRAGECVTLDTRADANEIAVLMKIKHYIPTSERNFTAPRLTEMSKQGVVEPIGKKKCQYTGKLVTVYHLREE